MERTHKSTTYLAQAEIAARAHQQMMDTALEEVRAADNLTLVDSGFDWYVVEIEAARTTSTRHRGTSTTT